MKPRVIAFYLPQFYPTDFNDKWWEPGFTEWTNVAKARPLFPGHYQPKLPGALGFYDLRVPDTRERQAELAKNAGVESFMYWHYWTDGKKVLNEVFEDVVKSQKPEMGFCLCWANHSWTKNAWNGFTRSTMLLEQKYTGEKDHIAHFYDLLPAFKDKRYTRINGKLLFAIFAPFDLPETAFFIETWNSLAQKNNLKGFYFVALNRNPEKNNELLSLGYSAVVEDLMSSFRESHYVYNNVLFRFLRKYCGLVIGNNYSDYCKFLLQYTKISKSKFPCVYPNWDHSARSGKVATIFRNAHPPIWGQLCRNLFALYSDIPEEEALFFIKSWNEWGEGNYMEPDRKYGEGYINELKKALLSYNNYDCE